MSNCSPCRLNARWSSAPNLDDGVELAGEQAGGERDTDDHADVAQPGLLEEQLGRPLAEDVEDDLHGRDARILDRLQRLLDLLDAHAVCLHQPFFDQAVAGFEDSRRVVGVPRRTVQLDEVGGLDAEILERALEPAAQILVGVVGDQLPAARRPNLVATVRASSRSRSSRATSRSERPSPYTSAVSKNVTPASTAACIAASDSSSSVSPQLPPIAHAPKPISETSRFVFPSRRACTTPTLAAATGWQPVRR